MALFHAYTGANLHLLWCKRVLMTINWGKQAKIWQICDLPQSLSKELSQRQKLAFICAFEWRLIQSPIQGRCVKESLWFCSYQ